MIRAGNLEAARDQTIQLLERIRADFAAGRGVFVEITEKTSPASLHDRRAFRRIEIALAEVDAALKHLRRALKEGSAT